MTVYCTFQQICKNKTLRTLKDFYSLLLNLLSESENMEMGFKTAFV
jgi:hypothetical protein